MFNLKAKVIAITGAAGVLGGEIACGLVELGARVAIMDLRTELPEAVKKRLARFPEDYIVVKCDVLSRESIDAALQQILNVFNTVDMVINGAGGNNPKATTSGDQPFFDIPPE